MRDWKLLTLGEICDQVGGVIQTGPFGSSLHQSDYSQDGIPLVMPKDIIGGKINTESIARVSSEHAERLSRHKLNHGDIVYGRRGDIGRQALTRKSQEGWLCGTGCLRLSLGDSIVEPSFLHYYLNQPDTIGWITNQAIGSTMPNLNTRILRSVPICVPPLGTQRKISTILSAYDDLLETNLRRIKILETMAQNLYREWFVTFRFPDHQNVRFIDTPLGRVPDGWEVCPMPDAVTIRPTIAVPKNVAIPFVSMGCLSESSMLINEFEYRSVASGARFQNGDTLFARITPCLENGKTGFVQFLPNDDMIGCGSTEFIVLRSKKVCPEYVYLMARSDTFRDNAIKSMSGATGRQRVQEECFNKFLLAKPPEKILNMFHAITRPQFELIHSLNLRNRLLRRTRDMLLPKLISGDVDVTDLDITIPEDIAV